MEEVAIRRMLEDKGFIDEPVSPQVNLVEEIQRLKREKNAVILGHFYITPELQDISDFLGDSLALARKAQETDADVIVFLGVHFMAETAKILNPDKKVIIPDLKAGCSLAESAPKEAFAKFKAEHPGHKVISYINCTADIKTLSDVIVTSSNAKKIVDSFPEDAKLIFAPDKNLGNYLNSQTGRDMVLWDGACMVHEKYSLERILELMDENPDAEFIAHPECEKPVLMVAKYVGSTTALLNYVQQHESKKFIVATESGILHQMQKACPDKVFIPAPSIDSTCGCNDCTYMKLNTVQKLYLALKHERPEINLDADTIEKAKAPILRMLELS
ncbi:quinolinate synthase NadA [Prolixibacter sp. NT017]|uniref:quinolinate synthase NadA n=1 Tax=Prolixibacter sp. NT017 TaxID=2652390 RepID=UPI00126BD466|nr:quinolinate synthase NadA [Prolixibacter sp. NT017]GET27124.1 quinolinate synthase A [Prolixibacter sp. NT017]